MSRRTLRRLLCATAAAWAAGAGAATVAGSVISPTSDNGYRAWLDGAEVRVEGTDLSAPVELSDHYTGTFTLRNVPAGEVVLLLVEPEGQDTFTRESARLRLDLAGDVSGATFPLACHWASLPSYPPPWRDARYDIWQPFFASEKVGFLLFYGRGLDPATYELWRTADGGTSWSRIGLWVVGTAPAVPSVDFEQAMLFADADHGIVTARAGPPSYLPTGVLRTADGGATWTHVDLPNSPPAGGDPGGNGLVSLVRFAAIDATRWIACGSENLGSYMGSGTPGYVTVWETPDAGETWSIATTWREDYGTCSALSATPAGKAILFDTPYAFGGTRRLLLRDASGTWTARPENDLVTNSGYGGADVPMVGDTAWVSAQEYQGTAGLVDQGLYRSDDAGATWSKISGPRPQYMSFADPLVGFGLGGQAVVTRDGGLTWRSQSQGGGVCCHGNRIWAFGATEAIWQDGGVGDPDGVSDVFTYREPRLADLEVLPGAAIADVTLPARTAASRVPVLAFRVEAHGPVPLHLATLTFRDSGTGDESSEVQAVRLWWDGNGNGSLDPEDLEIASGAFAAGSGTAALAVASGPVLREGSPRSLLATYDLAAIRHLRTFRVVLAASDVSAAPDDGGEPAVLAATAPPGTALSGATLTVMAHADLAVSQADSPDPAAPGEDVTYLVTVRNRGPDDAASVMLTDSIPDGTAFVSAGASQGSCALAGGTVTCSLGEIASGAAASATVVVRPQASGTLSNQAQAIAAEVDPVPSNGVAVETTAVVAPASGGGGGGGGGCGGSASGWVALLAALPALRRASTMA